MRLLWTAEAWEEFAQCLDSDPDLAAKIVALLKDIRRSPFAGLGKPEPLRGSLAGWWSRRITREHRLVYRVTGHGADQRVEIVQCRYHYERR
jgi:toxin YoeB